MSLWHLLEEFNTTAMGLRPLCTTFYSMRTDDTNERMLRLEDKMDRGFREINKALNTLIELNTRYEGLSKQVDNLEADSDFRFDKVEEKVDKLDDRLDSLALRIAYWTGGGAVAVTLINIWLNLN